MRFSFLPPPPPKKKKQKKKINNNYRQTSKQSTSVPQFIIVYSSFYMVSAIHCNFYVTVESGFTVARKTFCTYSR